MSGYPARRFGIEGRGFLAPDMFADVVIFDPESVADRATWAEPRLEPVGVDHVMVNGEMVVSDGTACGTLPGRIIR
ncbi:MAG: amidohydrolase family protein [Trueperaceae bacterium]